jgi:hypothetical protein
LTTKNEKIVRETVSPALFTIIAETIPEPEKILADSIDESSSLQPIPPQAPTTQPSDSPSAVLEPVTTFSSLSAKIPTIVAPSNATASYFTATTTATPSVNSTNTISNSTTSISNSTITSYASTTPTANPTNTNPSSNSTTSNFPTQSNTIPTTGASTPTPDPSGVLSIELN